MGIQTSLLASPQRCRQLADALARELAGDVRLETPPLSWTSRTHAWFAWPTPDGNHLCVRVHRLSRRTSSRWVEPSEPLVRRWNQLPELHEYVLDDQELDPSLAGAFWIAGEAARRDVADRAHPEAFWAKKRDVLYEGFGIEWRSPDQLNPLLLL